MPGVSVIIDAEIDDQLQLRKKSANFGAKSSRSTMDIAYSETE